MTIHWCAVPPGEWRHRGKSAIVWNLPAGCSPTQASGTGYSQHQSLTGSTFQAKVLACPIDNIDALQPATTYTWSDFPTLANGVRVGIDVNCKGLIGTGVTSDVLIMNAGTSTHAADVPAQSTGQTNQLYLMVFDHDNLDLSCLTIQGTDQGHFYNGIRMVSVANGSLRNLKFIGAGPGNWHFPPGETFVINDYQGSNNTFTDIFCEGRMDGATGIGEGATAFGQNSTAGGTFTRCTANYFAWSAAFALWQGSGTIELVDCGGDKNRTHLNLERMGQEIGGQGPACTINIRNFTFGDYIQTANGYGQDVFLGNDRGSTEINFYDPIIKPGRSVPPGRNANQIFIYNPTQEQGNTNIQQKADIHVFVNGVEQVRDSYIDWQN